jgi:hypothetical protein
MKKYFQNGVMGENFKWNLCVNFKFIAYYDINLYSLFFAQNDSSLVCFHLYQ